MKSDFENRLELFNQNSLEISNHLITIREHTNFIKNFMNKHVSSLDRSLTENLSTNSAKDSPDYELIHLWNVSNPMQSPVSFWELTSDTPSSDIGFTGPTFGQRRVMEALSWYDNVAVTSGERVGVTHLSVIYASWFLLHYEDSRVIITGSSETRSDWYNCFFNYHKGTLLPGDVGLKWIPYPDINDESYLLICSPDIISELDTHCLHQLVVFDEGSTMTEKNYKDINSMRSDINDDCFMKFLIMGKPYSRDSEFYKCCIDENFYYITLSATEHENYLLADEDDQN